jgi:hypothetical protein
MRKAQVQAISLILITGIVLSLAGAAYFWGRPIIEKRSTLTDISTAKAFILQLNDDVLDVARNKGEKVLNIPALSAASLLTNESENGMVFQFLSNQPMLAVGDETLPIPVDTKHIEPNGTYGESPRIVTIQSRPHETAFLMILKLTYRKLETQTPPKKGYQIVIRPIGSKRGNNKVTVSYGGTESAMVGGVDVLRTIINIKIS